MPSSPLMPLKYSKDEEDLNEGENLTESEGEGSREDEGEYSQEAGGECSEENEAESEKEDENSNTPRPVGRMSRQLVNRKSSVARKTKEITYHLRRLKLSFGDFVEEAVQKAKYQNQLTRKPELIYSLYTQAQLVGTSEEANHAKYRAELRSMAKSKHFKVWKAEYINHLKTKASDVIKEMETRAPRLMSMFQVITRPEDRRSNREKTADNSRWVAIMAILLYTYMPRTCTRWPTMWGLQLHTNGAKRRVVEALYHTGITVGYKAVLETFQKLSKLQKARLRELGRTGNFLIVYDNFEKNVKVKDQRMDNKSEFFSVTTAQIIEPTWMPERGLKQRMFNRKKKLDWVAVAKH